ncbi:MAG: hypothetical protein QW112_02830, partial [Candidatus Micrarchaeia archaeon]
SKTVLGNVDELMRSENGDAKRMVAKMPLKRQFQVIKALAHIYCTDDNYARNGKALTLICCTIGVGWEMLDGWRERYRNTGEIRFTDSEKDYIRARIAAVATEVARENGGVKT